MIQIPFEQYRLSNGMRVILSREAHAGVVAVNLWYHVGSKNERSGRTGFAHLFEHMMFQGSENVPETAHFALVEKAGGSLNGSTWLDRTNYFETLPAHFLELALWLEADRMGYLLPALTQAKLDNQRDVVKNERRWRVDNQPYGDWDERLQALVYPPEHPYHHSVIGSMEDLDAATLDDVEQFFRTYYAPNNAVLTICGEFEPDQARSWVERYFSGLPSGPPIPAVPGTIAIPLKSGREVRARVEQDISLARIYLGFRIPPYGSEEFYAAFVAAAVLSWGKASLLYRELVRDARIAQDIVSYAFPIVEGAAMHVMWATVRPGIGEEVLEAALLTQIAGLASIDAAEVARAIHLIEARQLSELQRMEDRADQLSMHATLFDDPARVNTEIDRIRAVTPEAVRNFAGEYLDADNRVVLWYVPEARTAE